MVLVLLLSVAAGVFAQEQPFSRQVNARVASFRRSTWIKVPMITWGADLVTSYANGNSERTASGSPFARQDLKIELFR